MTTISNVRGYWMWVCGISSMVKPGAVNNEETLIRLQLSPPTLSILQCTISRKYVGFPLGMCQVSSVMTIQ